MVDENTGEKVSLTKKCADINAEVPILMGVSKAILENVVFVHQEDSNWPLGEGAVLKKKFDDIFSATKYTKALEHIRKLRVEQVGEIKDAKAKCEMLRVRKDHAVKLTATRDDNEQKARALEAQIASVDENIEKAMKSVEDMTGALAGARRLAEEKLSVDSKLSAVKVENERKVKRIDNVYTESLEELESLREQFTAKFATMKEELAQLHSEVKDLHMQTDALKDKKDSEFHKIGKLQAEAEQHAKRLANRVEHAKQVAKENREIGQAICNAILNMSDDGEGDEYDDDDDDDEMVDATQNESARNNTQRSSGSERESTMKLFRKALGERLQVLQDAAKNAREKRQNAHAEATSAIVNVDMSIKRNEEKICDKQTLREELRANIDSITKDLTQSATVVSIDEYKKNEQEAKEIFDKRSKEVEQAGDGKAEMAEIENDIESIDKKLQDLRSEQEEAARAGETQVKIRLKRDEIAAKKEALSSILNSRKDRLEAAFQCAQSVPEPLLLSDEVKKIEKERCDAAMVSERELASSKTMKESRRREVDAAETILNSCKNDARVCEEQASDAPTAVLLGDKGLLGVEDAMHKINEDMKEAQKTREYMRAGNVLLTDYLQKAVANTACPMCTRGFPNIKEMSAFEKRLQTIIDAAPDQLAINDKKIAECEAKRETLLGLMTIAARYKELKEKRIPAAEVDLVKAQDALEEACATERRIEQALDGAKKARDTIIAVVEDAATISRHAQELNTLETQLKMMPGGMTTGRETEIRSITAIAGDLDVEQANRENKENQLKVLRRKKERTDNELAQLDRNWRDAKDALADAERNQLKTISLREKKKKFEKDQEQATRDIEALERELPPLKDEKNKLEREREERVKVEKDNEDAVDDKMRTLQKSIDFFDSLNDPIQKYIESNARETLKEIQKSFESADVKIDATLKKLATKQKEYKSKEKSVNKQSEIQRTLEDNIALQHGKKDEKQLEMRIKELQETASKLGNVKDLGEELKRREKVYNQLEMTKAEAAGQVKTHREMARNSEKELKSAEYKNIDSRLSKETIRFQTLEMVNNDLNRYYAALDKALMAFHSSKMGDINKVVKELWQRTYRGQDIDYIQICSDAEKQEGKSGGKSSYNYRVVMICNGAELEMRGRCSAGQKVLACLIIRLALAETFCLNCGILALDEPTTNLDTPNAESLARSLIDIMHSRREQENFQLIVITHDVEFAHMLGQRQQADYYWRVTKDENQHSCVEREDIYE
jgi:DNA repair protein RAD50